MYNFSMDFDPRGCVFENFSYIINCFGIPLNVVEVGTFEGKTSLWLSDNLTPHNKNLKITTIDPHIGSNDMDDNFTMVKNNFTRNIKMCQYKNITHISKSSIEGLLDLINQNVKVELIYIDGDHKASGVLSDLVLSWKILKVGGVIICDDATTWKFRDSSGFCSSQMSPRLAIESFIQCYWHKLDVLKLPHSTQTAFIKLEE